ncbi:hypothetical protein C8R43DRAFT_862722, partial [Mycena crocata]
PISIGDVLVGIHSALHQRITHTDWAKLGLEAQSAVSGAFVKLCHAEAARRGESPTQERNQGVKRVDFLLGKTMFRGLIR